MTIAFTHQSKNHTSLKSPQKTHFEKNCFYIRPIRFFNQSTLNAKPLLRDLRKMDTEWDKPIKDHFADRWKEISEDLNAIKEEKLQRFIGNKEAEVLCFCDASNKAYRTTIHLRCRENGPRITNLIFTKSRIAPLKETSLPRLELLAVLIGTRSINFITQSFHLKIHRKTLWTDSQCVLPWLKLKKFLTPFVQRRIDEIQSNKSIEFRYVSTAQNPADIASRGCTVKILNGNEFWWHRPTWLQKDHDNWPTWNVNILSKDIMDAILTENKEPKTIYEVSSLAEEDLANNNQEDRKENIKKNHPQSK